MQFQMRVKRCLEPTDHWVSHNAEDLGENSRSTGQYGCRLTVAVTSVPRVNAFPTLAVPGTDLIDENSLLKVFNQRDDLPRIFCLIKDPSDLSLFRQHQGSCSNVSQRSIREDQFG